MVTDTISDFLTRIRNATLIKSQRVSVPNTKSNLQIAQLLQYEGFIDSCQLQDTELIIQLKYQGREQKSCITNLKRLSKPGRRIYAKSKDLPRVLGGMGILILSTSSGLITDRQARAAKIGGELICSVW
uniref:Small ribosomal subunit protein uS8c n=1 Tax=Marsupiomonas sp. NIES 1824 TaxID=1562198 RepID=A0A097KLY4_9CHLO|nr:ribosomal protein S8 [Marsupiomonas sp. NIES 1824]